MSRLPSCDCRLRPIESASCTPWRCAAPRAVGSGTQYKFASGVARAPSTSTLIQPGEPEPAISASTRLLGPTRSEPPVCQLLLQPLRQLHPVAEVPAISARAANDGLSVCFRMAARSAAKLLSEPQRGSVLAVVAG